jgi:energy-coupling factor transporter ATP-binding protein EcfA2
VLIHISYLFILIKHSSSTKLTKGRICNLYSYLSEDINLENYNVIVGPNSSGKTNIIRILEILSTDHPSKREETVLSLNALEYPLDSIRLKISSKFDRDAPSLLRTEVMLSKVEIKILLQLLFRTFIDTNTIHEKLRKLTLIIYWPATPNETEEPELILARFENGFTIWKRGNSHNIGYIASIPDDVEQLHGLVSNTRNIYGGS